MAKKPTFTKGNVSRRRTPRSLSHRHLWYGRDDIALLVQAPYIRRWFEDVFTGGFEYHFEHGRDVLRFTSARPLTSKSAWTGLTRLGLKKRFVDFVVNALTNRENTERAIPGPGRAQYDLWFGSLDIDHLPGREIKKIVAATPPAAEKWDRRLEMCGRSWDDATLSDEAIIRLTCELFQGVRGETVTPAAMRKQFLRWKQGKGLFTEEIARLSDRLLGEGKHPISSQEMLEKIRMLRLHRRMEKGAYHIDSGVCHIFAVPPFVVDEDP